MRKTKIVATIGPASRNYDIIFNMIKFGVNVARLNFSHETHEAHLKSAELVRKAEKELNTNIAIMQDLQGPKIRVGEIENGKMEIKEGQELILTADDVIGKGNRVSISYKLLPKEIEVGHRILLDDGLLELKVKKVKGNDIITEVITGGILKSRKGVNLPGVPISIPALTKKDESDLMFGLKNIGIHLVALSFVRTAKDVKRLLDILKKEGFDDKVKVISKIEKPEALEEIDDIIDASYGILIARGDLGVEVSPERVPLIQKMLIDKSNMAGKPVITATQMLESMMNSPRPTRAEATDVANAILDGTGAVMLSGETAAGKYPVEAVKMMGRIIDCVESSDNYKETLYKNYPQEEISVSDAVGFAASEVALKIHAKYIVCFTYSGSTSRLIAKYRPGVDIISLSPVEETTKRSALIWGTTGFTVPSVSSIDEMIEMAVSFLKRKKMVKKNDKIVVTAGTPVKTAGTTNLMKVVTVQ